MSKLVWTNGCFDICHVGHVRLLQYCREIAAGGAVIVGINSDESVKRLKGPDRPINTQEHRRETLLALRSVDQVVIFNDDTPYELIRQWKPDVIVKGGDYEVGSVIGADLCTDVRIFPYVEGHSTTQAIERSRRGR